MKLEFKKSILEIFSQIAIDDQCRSGYLLGYNKNDVTVVDELFIPEQQTTSYGTTLSNAVYDEIISDYGPKIVGEILSHGNMPPFESGITQRSREKLTRILKKSLILLVVNNQGQHIIYGG